jgi:glycosyltransferase involved in cell wall biosynthesis
MRVCLDIQSAVTQRAGVGRYTRLLAEHLSGCMGPHDEFVAFYFDFQRQGEPPRIPGARLKAWRHLPGRVIQKAWKTLDWPPFDRLAGPADVFHFPNFIRPPLRRGASVVTIHDLAFLRHPDTIESGNYDYLSRRIHRTVEWADAILTVSEFTASEVQELLHVPRSRIHAVWSGLDPAMQRPAPAIVQALCERLRLDRPYLLLVGTLEPRKNIPFLVEVFERIAGFDGDLVLAGRRGWKYEPILARLQQSPRGERIRLLEDIGEHDLAALYAGAELLVLPSLYEGFGFPPLEAMACGTPAVVSDGGSLPEVCGDAALVIRGFDADQWAHEIAGLLGDAARLADLRARGLDHVRRFTWEETARRTWDLYHRALADHGKRRYARIPLA